MIKKGQVWSLDFVVALVIFSIALYFFYSYGAASLETQNEEIEEMFIQAEQLSQNLISSGYPNNWTNSSVISIGLTDGETRLEVNKIAEFSKMNYQDAKNLLSSKYDFQVKFKDKNNQTLEIANNTILGKNMTSEDPNNIIPIKRFLFYNTEIITMEVLVW